VLESGLPASTLGFAGPFRTRPVPGDMMEVRSAHDPWLRQLLALQAQLLQAARHWSHGQELGDDVAAVRHEALRLNHLRYGALIPSYQRLASALQLLRPLELNTIINNLMFPDLFKSYDRSWLDSRDFKAMTAWIGDVCTRLPGISLDGVHEPSEWRLRLRADGLFLSYSSGTSGRISFVPRDGLTWKALCTNGSTYANSTWFNDPQGNAATFDCLVVGPRGSGMGILDAGAGLARMAERSHFLFDAELRDDVVHNLGEGGSRPSFLESSGLGDGHYHRAFGFARQSGNDNRPLLVFGAPFQIKRFCEQLSHEHGRLQLAPSSTLVTGGGWKSFTGEQISQQALRSLAEETLGIDRAHCIDAYSATELNCAFSSCAEGNYHIPPLIEPVVLDEAFMGAAGEQGFGTLGFLDPFAMSYPGFVITGDQGRLSHARCRCGLTGWLIQGEIQRTEGAEIRGCGGVLASIMA
jgi:acyl-protein synthetase LuxE